MPITTRRGQKRAHREEAIAKFAVGYALAPTLPAELLTEIISYIPSLPVDEAYFAPGTDIDKCEDRLLPPRQLRRTITLRSLSQTCRLWRQVFLPLLWETVELASLRVEEDATWSREINKALRKKCKGLIENDGLAAYVKHMRVVLVSSSSQKEICSTFVECLDSLPNLKSLAFHFVHSKIAPALSKAFHGHVYPDLRTLALHEEAAKLFPCFPNLTKLVTISSHGHNQGGHSILSIAARQKTVYPNIEAIDGFQLYNQFDRDTVLECMPNLRFVGFVNNAWQIQALEATYDFLSKLTKLQTIRLYAWCSNPHTPDKTVEDALHLTKAMFEQHPLIPDRQILLHSFSGKWTKVVHIR